MNTPTFTFKTSIHTASTDNDGAGAVDGDSRRAVGPVLIVEYQVEPFFVKFSMSASKKGCRQGPAYGIVCIRGYI
jgi:hypothetical protein